MNNYEVWYRKVGDGRAPSIANLAVDYTCAGLVEASDRRTLERKLAAEPDPNGLAAGVTRRIHVGDVVIEKRTGAAFIYTPLGAWATVEVL